MEIDLEAQEKSRKGIRDYLKKHLDYLACFMNGQDESIEALEIATLEDSFWIISNKKLKEYGIRLDKLKR